MVAKNSQPEQPGADEKTALRQALTAQLSEAEERLKLSTVFTIPLLIISLSQILHGQAGWVEICTSTPRVDLVQMLNGWLQFALACPQLYLARPIIRNSLGAIKSATLDLYVALSAAIGAAFFYSLYMLFIFSRDLLRGANHTAITMHWELFALLVSLSWLGLYIKERWQTSNSNAD